jgi:hypothetical protein
MRAQQRAFDAFRATYNGERPHDALGGGRRRRCTRPRRGPTRRGCRRWSTPGTTSYAG